MTEETQGGQDQNSSELSGAEAAGIIKASADLQEAAAGFVGQLKAAGELLTAAAQQVEIAKEQLETAGANAETPAPPATEQIITTTQTELEKVVADAVQAAVEAAKPAAEDSPQAAETAITAAVQTEVTAQVEEKVTEQVAGVMKEIQQVVQQAEDSAAQTKKEADAQVQEVKAEMQEIKTHVEALTAPPAIPENGKPETIIAKHLASTHKASTYSYIFSFALLTIILLATTLVFAMLYFTEYAKNGELILKNEQQAAIAAETAKELAVDLISSQLLKNDEIDKIIQRKIDGLKKEGMAEAAAIPSAYIDGEVVMAATEALPMSVRKLPYAQDMLFAELSRISKFAQRELQRESLPTPIKQQ